MVWSTKLGTSGSLACPMQAVGEIRPGHDLDAMVMASSILSSSAVERP